MIEYELMIQGMEELRDRLNWEIWAVEEGKGLGYHHFDASFGATRFAYELRDIVAELDKESSELEKEIRGRED